MGGRRRGAPTKYKPEYCERVYDVVGEHAKTIEHFACEIGVHKDTVYEWAKVHADFSDALRLAVQKAQCIWVDRLEDMMIDKGINAPLVKLYFANRFNWHERSARDDTERSEPITINVIRPGDIEQAEE